MDNWINRRDVLKATAWLAFAPPLLDRLGMPMGMPTASATSGGQSEDIYSVDYLPVSLDVVPYPKNITFTVSYPGKRPVTLTGHYWYNANALRNNQRCPAIVELNPYRCRDGTLYVDSKMFPWFAYNGYLCFRVDLQGSGSSSGTMTDEYTDEELSYCVQVINQVAALPFCDGNVGMMGESWSAINSLMVAARPDCPAALKAIVVNCGTDDRYNDDVHYMGGAMMADNASWPSSMWGWLPAPPDPAVVGDGWKEIWRDRIQNMGFWFDQWATHQTRDSYWSDTSVRGHYADVKVPVFIMSGWLDGYKNPVDHAVRGLGELGRPVTAMLGPWGHRYPFDAFPGPRIDWLRYVVSHWWDRWLKGSHPDPAAQWPELSVWLGESREPPRDRVPDYNTTGRWVSEDHAWMSRMKPVSLYLGPNGELSASSPVSGSQTDSAKALTVAGTPLTMGTSMLETSSFGHAGNDDLPGDQSADDRRSMCFDSAPLTEDVECFGYPEVRLNVECDKPIASLAIRLTEVSPTSGESHLVSYSFFNLAYRDGDQAHPQPIPSGPFAINVQLNIFGHVFKRGWKVRLAISPFYFPTLWQAPEIPTVKLYTGRIKDLDASVLVLPGRNPRPEDAGMAALLPPRTTFVDPELYAPTLRTIREGGKKRSAAPVVVDGRPGMMVQKDIDSGSAVFGGILDNLEVDVTSSENIRILDGDPLSDALFSHSETSLARGDWKVKVVTDTRVWSEAVGQDPSDGAMFRYVADIHTFIGDQPFENAHVQGAIPRLWV